MFVFHVKLSLSVCQLHFFLAIFYYRLYYFYLDKGLASAAALRIADVSRNILPWLSI